MYLYNYRRIMAGSTLYSYPLNLNTSESRGNGDHRITFQVLQPRFGATDPALGDIVAMYLPADALKTSYSQSYGDVELGAAGLAVMTGNQAAAEGAFSSALSGNFVNALEKLGNVTTLGNVGQAAVKGVAAEAQAAASSKLGTAVQALERKVGKIRNPHKAIIYQGPGGFRTFSFTFVMMPKSKKEAEEINKIVHFFKYHMHPGVNTNIGAAGGGAPGGAAGLTAGARRNQVNTSSSLTLSYPEEFKIRITPRGLDGDSEVGSRSLGGKVNTVRPLFRIEKCFLESLNVDYTTSGQPVFFDDGTEPVTTTLALSFKETQLMTKESIRQGF